MGWKFKHHYFGNDWQDPTKILGKENFISSHQVAREIAYYYWRQETEDPESFEEIIKVMDSDGGVREFAVTAELNVDFTAHEIK